MIFNVSELPKQTWNAFVKKIHDTQDRSSKDGYLNTVELSEIAGTHPYYFHIHTFEDNPAYPWRIQGVFKRLVDPFPFEIEIEIQEIMDQNSLGMRSHSSDFARWQTPREDSIVGHLDAIETLMKFVHHTEYRNTGGLKDFLQRFFDDMTYALTKLAVHPDREAFLPYWQMVFMKWFCHSGRVNFMSYVGTSDEVLLEYFQAIMDVKS